MPEVSMWLYPIALAAAIGLVLNLRFGWRWTWGICLQQFLILIAGLAGFAFLYAPLPAPYAVAREEYAGYAAYFAWGLFGVFNLGQKFLLNRLSLELALFRVQQAMQTARILRSTLWGPPGKYWYDIAVALNFYHEGNIAEGDAVVEKWRKDPRLPLHAREGLVGFHMLGRVLTGDWHTLIREFESNQKFLEQSKTFVSYQLAARAYAEIGQFAEAEICMRKANVQPQKTSTTTLDINFMTLFALFGAEQALKSVYARSRDYRALPQYVRDYWLGRCYSVRGDAPNAVQALQKCKGETPPEISAWHSRIDYALANAPTQHEDRSADSAIIGRAEGMYRHLRRVIEILRPDERGKGVIFLVVLVVAAFGVQQMQPAFETFGKLSLPLFKQGDYYRTVTYLFLHGNTAHLLLNTFALILFGRPVEHSYGTAKFLVIFFVSGILSGILQIFFIQDDFVIGASGAILGIFGAAMAALVKLKPVLPPPVRKAELRWMASIALLQVVFDQIVNGIAALTDKNPDGVRIGAFAHMGGMVFGFIIAMLLPLRKFSDDDA